jgi:ADP-dependent NAD(P)H-hydrate dehydratase
MNKAGWTALDARMLRAWPLPGLDGDADKEDRGYVLVVAGSRETPGAAELAGVAALRAGAGKLVIATAQSIAAQVAQTVPEARVIALPEDAQGAMREDGVMRLEPIARALAAVAVGPGWIDPRGNMPFVSALLDRVRPVPVVLDACAMDIVGSRERFDQPVLLTPHAGEMAHLLGIDKAQVTREAERTALTAARRWNAVITLKGGSTLVATPSGEGWRHEACHPGLATSGSGDVLAGLIAGFAARQATLAQACAWGVVVHALAGQALARELGPLGYLARELPGMVPQVLRKLQRRPAFSRVRRPKAG